MSCFRARDESMDFSDTSNLARSCSSILDCPHSSDAGGSPLPLCAEDGSWAYNLPRRRSGFDGECVLPVYPSHHSQCSNEIHMERGRQPVGPGLCQDCEHAPVLQGANYSLFQVCSRADVLKCVTSDFYTSVLILLRKNMTNYSSIIHVFF